VSEPLVTDAVRTREQGRRLRTLRQQAGISKGRLMDAVGLTTTNGYDLYERGTSVIRLDRVEDWAAAFGLAPLDFVAAILGIRSVEDVLAPPAVPWSFRLVLREGGLPDDDVERWAQEWEGRELADQQAAAWDIVEGFQESRRSSHGA
jgi:transcriptional regulator with XRE-family HTH domain